MEIIEKSITVYQTSDGKQFHSKYEATEWTARLFLSNLLYGNTFETNSCKVNALIESCDEVLALFQAIENEYEAVLTKKEAEKIVGRCMCNNHG